MVGWTPKFCSLSAAPYMTFYDGADQDREDDNARGHDDEQYHGGAETPNVRAKSRCPIDITSATTNNITWVPYHYAQAHPYDNCRDPIRVL